MRIALVTPYDPFSTFGGQERLIADIYRQLLRRKNTQVEMFSLSAKESAFWARFAHIPVSKMLARKIGSFSSFDIVHANSWATEAVFSKKPKAPVLATLYGTIAQYMQNVPLSPWKRAYLSFTQLEYEKNACRKTKWLASLCRKQEEEMRLHYGCAQGSVRPIDCGIDTSLFYPREKQKAKEKLGLGKYEKIVLACARWDMPKGFDILLKLAAKLDSDTVLIANGRMPPQLRRLMPPNMIATKMEPEELPFLYSAADVFVHPSRYEGFGLVTAEAMACGVPAVAFDTGAARDLIGNDEQGVLVKQVGDADGFIAAATSLLSDSSKAGEMGKRAAKHASGYTIGKTVDEYLKYYWEIASHGQNSKSL